VRESLILGEDPLTVTLSLWERGKKWTTYVL
jgi:hypothetical protein